MSASATLRGSTSRPLYRNTRLRGTTRSFGTCDRLLMTLSVMPSARYSAPGSVPLDANGSTARERVPRAGRRLGPGTAMAALDVATPGSASNDRRASATSAADWKRARGSFSRLCETISAYGTGSAGTLRRSGGGSDRMAASDAAGVGRANARVPVTSSARMQPSAKMSAGTSVSSPRTCSGAMYPMVPNTRPGSVMSIVGC